MTDYNFISANDKKFHLDQNKIINIYYEFKNNKKLIKPLKKKIKKINITDLSNNIIKFNLIMNKIWPSFNKNNTNKTKKLIKKYFKINNKIKINIIYKIFKNFKQNNNINQNGGFIILDILGLVPIIGIPFDILSTILSLAEGDFFVAIISLLAIVPGLGTFPGIGKIGIKIFKTFFNVSSFFDITSFLPGSDVEDEVFDEDFDEDYIDDDYDEEDYYDEDYKEPNFINNLIDSFVPSPFKPFLEDFIEPFL
jgi:hypothetical protein